ncbi:MAG TPA: M56 family metallopeptidase [Sphingomonas sp.]|jgi:beta-lactamase regulating signal transducer with metallopeptidase domain|uniref:M56 family metallopeptidase n=1 Tax=Sphingomonas sp. TaxID=28214 RepID=UPI002ED80DEB
MNAAIAWFGGTMTAATLLMLAVLIVRAPAARLFGAKVAYALWLLPALRMILPSLPARWVPTPGGIVFTRQLVGWGPASPPPGEALILPAPMATGPDWLAIAALIWAAGALCHLLWHVIAYRLFLRRALRRAVQWTHAAGIRVMTCPELPGPVAAGILRRLILLPADFTSRFDPDERRLVLAHETAHHVRGDLVANLLALVILSLHWFNPVAHRAYRAFRDDQETACDATVLDAEAADRRHAYGTAILKSASCRVPGAACALNHAGALKRRIHIMIDGRKPRPLRIAGLGLALLLVTAGLIGTASTSAASQGGGRSIHVDGPDDRRSLGERGHIRPTTPAEQRQVQRAVEQATHAATRARRNADTAMRRAQRALANLPRPPAPPLPALPPAPFGPPPPLPALEAPTIDRNAIAAEVAAAMHDARQAILAAQADVARTRITWARNRQIALRNATAHRAEAIIIATEAGRAAEAARPSFP